MTERKKGADLTNPAAASKRKRKPTAKEIEAGKANLAKGREAKRKAREEAEADPNRMSASERWARLLDGTLTVADLDEEELARMKVKGKDGTFNGPGRAVPSHLAQAMQKEGIKRATEMFRTAAPRAVKRLLEIADDPDTKDADAIRALDIVMNRGLGKMPETVLIEERSKFEDNQSSVFGVDRESVED